MPASTRTVKCATMVLVRSLDARDAGVYDYDLRMRIMTMLEPCFGPFAFHLGHPVSTNMRAATATTEY